MKKLLSLLTITTLTTSVPATLLAVKTQERTKRDVSTLTSNSNNDYLPLKEFKNIRGDIYRMTTDTKDNIYFSVFVIGAYKLLSGPDIPTKVDGISGQIISLAVDNKDNIYFGTKDSAFVLEHKEITPTKINGFVNNGVNSIAVDSKDNIYFGTKDGAYGLSVGATTPTTINGISGFVNAIAIDSENNIYFDKFQKGAFVLKHRETTPTKVDGISNNIQSITIDSKKISILEQAKAQISCKLLCRG